MKYSLRPASIKRFLASTGFFRVVMVIFVFEALWIALSAVYPMAFDEDFHFGIIRIYAHHWLPFLPAEAAPNGTYGAVSRDPSFLYHYLMSFPYRLVALFTASQTAQVIVLRLINIALFGGALVLFRKMLLRTGLSGPTTNISLLLFVLIPIVPLVAGQINYDNLVLLMTAWMLLLAVRASAAIAGRRLPLGLLAGFILVGMTGSVVKYAFLPIFAGAGLVLLAQIIWTFRRSAAFKKALHVGYRAVSPMLRGLLLAALIILSLFWVQRYGVNLVRYHKVIPDCAKVLSVEQCKNYGPWSRNYTFAQSKHPAFRPDPVFFTEEWWKGMWRRTFFVINGNVPVNTYQNAVPLPIPKYAGAAIAGLCVLSVVVYARRVFAGRWDLALLLATVLLYCGALFVQNFKSYDHTGVVVAVNGRYLLLVLLPAAAFAGRALSIGLRRRQRIKILLATAAVVLMLEGGLFEFIVQSNDTWYWPNPAVRTVNDDARRILGPIAAGNQADTPS